MDSRDTAEVERIAMQAAVRAAQQTVELCATRAAQTIMQEYREEWENNISTVVHETLIQLGIDHRNPLEMQQDFQHLRKWRKAGEDMKSKVTLAILTVFVTGVLAMVAVGFKEWLGK